MLMKPSGSLLVLASVATCLLEGAHGFVVPINNLAAGGVTSGTHDVCSSAAIYSRSSSSSSHQHLLHRNSRRLRHESPSLMMMAAAGKKRKRRKVRKDTNPPAPPASPAAAITPKKAAANSGAGAGAGGGVGELGDVLEGDRSVEALFSDDWSGMPANTGMTKSNVPLPDISEFKPSRRAESTLEQREKKSAVGLVVGAGDGIDDDDDAVPASRLAGFESKLTPIVDREEEWRKKNAAERFEEGPIVRGLKTATWFSICTLVLWEVYINSPWFHAPESPPPIL